MNTAARLLVTALAAGALLCTLGQVAADYPPPVGSLSASASDITPEAGSDVTVTCTLLDTNGRAIAGQPCTFTIISQPGGASFDGAQSTMANTGADGVATVVLSTGTNPGTIVVETGSGALTSQVTITSGSGLAQLPDTGATPASSAPVPWSLTVAAITAGTLLAAASAFALARIHRNRA